MVKVFCYKGRIFIVKGVEENGEDWRERKMEGGGVLEKKIENDCMENFVLKDIVLSSRCSQLG